ncbi:MAG: glycosyltransferase [Candidatus Omnitrophica bacterium]|nr:glycosyltransferase [Candidatus Omnitrophota bacterium]
MTQYPKISIVTPSFNQARYLEATILSVINQDYPNIEYIIIDGGSTDGSVEIIKKYEKRLKYWVSEPDKGQADAINKGFQNATGEIVTWINSDDIYADNSVLSKVAGIFPDNPDKDIISGRCVNISHDGKLIGPIKMDKKHISEKYIKYRATLIQPGVFFRRSVMEKNILDISLHYTFDWDFFIRDVKKNNILPVDLLVAGYRRHEKSKTLSGRLDRAEEIKEIAKRYLGISSWQYKVLSLFCRLYEIDSALPGIFKNRLTPIIKLASAAVYFLSFKRIIRV